MDFGQALAALRAGHRVTRTGWNGTRMWLVLVPGSTITVEAGRPLGDAAPELVGSTVAYQPHIDLHTASGTIAPWTASQSDLLADDWYQPETGDSEPSATVFTFNISGNQFPSDELVETLAAQLGRSMRRWLAPPASETPPEEDTDPGGYNPDTGP